MNEIPKRIQLGPEIIGYAAHGDDGILRIGTPREDGTGIVEIRLAKWGEVGWCHNNVVPIFVDRYADNLAIAEIYMAEHSGYAQELTRQQQFEAARYPGGSKEYWRSEMVGKTFLIEPNRFMTKEDFETQWRIFEEESFFYSLNQAMEEQPTTTFEIEWDSDIIDEDE